jgi:tight adherence protein C
VAVMLVILIAFTFILITFYILSFNKYSAVLQQPDCNNLLLKNILPVGLYLLDTVKYSYNTSYDRKLLSAVIELYGHKQAVVLLKLYWGRKISLMLVSLLFALFIGTISVPDIGYAVFCLSLPAAIAYFSDRDLFDKVNKRRIAIQMDFPDFVNKLTLLVNAGMPVSKAWEKIASDSGRDTPLYMEISNVLKDIRSGVPEHKAYEEFAKRCRIPVITRFISVILQNIRKGNSELVPILRVFANECWELRKMTAKRYGEEASTKMLLPMLLMFAAILLIVGMPAVLALRNI